MVLSFEWHIQLQSCRTVEWLSEWSQMKMLILNFEAWIASWSIWESAACHQPGLDYPEDVQMHLIKIVMH